MSLERHYFPGNNTPMGFFSYYRYILGQREANKIVCIKGGPGTGKSTFLVRIAKYFADLGEDIDYLHCSADENSLDGVILKNRRIALIDGTSPHITDPITPGAVDKIVNLGEFWDENAIIENKDEIIYLNEETSKWYRIAYSYLNAAKNVYSSLEEIYNQAVEYGELYRIVSETINREYGEHKITFKTGWEKKFFASGLTASGVVHYLSSLLEGMEKIYLISIPIGFKNTSFMNILKEGAIYRGIDVESFYCPISPEDKIDHMILPQLKTAFLTVNDYHDIEPWEIFHNEGFCQEIVLIDICDYMNPLSLDQNLDLKEALIKDFDYLLEKGIEALSKAKKNHMRVEEMYIPNMNFTQVGKLCEDIIAEIIEK